MRIVPLGFLLLFPLAGIAQTSSDPAAAKTRALAINSELMAMTKGADSSDARWQAVDAEVDSYQKDYGATPQTTHNLMLLRQTELYVARKLGNDAHYDALVTKIAADPHPEVSALTAKLAALKTQPLDLKFTATNGSEIDFSKLRGKVVLVDFWATWCPDCVAETSSIVALSKKYAAQGFIVVGVSLDQDKAALDAYTKQNGMDWPQYFDGQGWKNSISSGYGIHSIPTLWLVDKKGMVTVVKSSDDLDGQVAKLLATP